MSAPQRISSVLLAHATRNSPTPFLYQTRTLLSPSQWQLPSQQCSAYSTQKPNSSYPSPEEPTQTKNDESVPENPDAPSVPGAAARPARKSYLRRRAANSSPFTGFRNPTKSHSMTSKEKQVFGELLEQLGVDKQDSLPPAIPTESAKPTILGEIPAANQDDRKDMAQISAIFDSVVQGMRRRQNRSPSSSMSPRAEALSDITAVEDVKLQEKLRDLTFTDEELTELLNGDKIASSRAIELVVQREAIKIETDLRAAISQREGETALWNFCQERIFSMIRHLKGSTQEEASILRYTELPPDHETVDPKASLLEVPTCVPIEAVVTALYPKMLLVAFRLLNLHFPDSKLIGQFRSTISSFGRESSVLGSSTALYNEMIYFNWRGCHDIPGVVSLLHEMEVTGVEPDRQTCGMLNAIVSQREDDLKSHWRQARRTHGKVTREPWWDLPPNRKAVRELLGPHGWIQRLEERIKHRKARERLYG